MRILVTGAKGFIGSRVLELALRSGHEVAGLIRTDTRKIDNQAGNSAVWLKGTLASPPWKQIENFAPDACVHTAWITDASCFESPENHKYLEWSKDFLFRLTELGTRHLTVTGTCLEFQLGGDRLSEERTPVRPQTLYAETKNDLRLCLGKHLAMRSQAVLCWARLFYVYGAGERPEKLCSQTIDSINEGRKVVLRTPDSVKDFIYVDDAAAALLRAVESNFNGALNIGTGQGVSVESLTKQLAAQMGRPDLVERSSEVDADPLARVVADNTRLQSLGWRPRTDLQRGLEATILWRSSDGKKTVT